MRKHRYSRTKYRMGKHRGTAEQTSEWENTQVQRYNRTKYRMGKHRCTAEQSTEWQNTEVTAEQCIEW